VTEEDEIWTEYCAKRPVWHYEVISGVLYKTDNYFQVGKKFMAGPERIGPFEGIEHVVREIKWNKKSLYVFATDLN
jgi:hypothetical protein